LPRTRAEPLWIEFDLVDSNRNWATRDASERFECVKLAEQKAGVRSMRFHDPNHLAPTLRLLKNVHLKVESEPLGHSTITIAFSKYS